MKIKLFNQFIKESKDSANIELHYFAFDHDDNILHMPTVIHMEKRIVDNWEPVDVSTSEFAKVRNDKENYQLLNNDPSQAFCEFRDNGPRGDKAFLEDLKKSLNEKAYAPAWDSFINCLKEGSIFAIITARGHEPESIRKGYEYIIDNAMTKDDQYEMYNNCLKHCMIFGIGDDFDRIPKGTISQTPLIKLYLDNCDFYGVSSDWFKSEFGEGSASNPEHAKQLALDTFIEKCNKFGKSIGASSVSVGFSDDDTKNVEHVKKFFKEKSALANDLLKASHKVKLNVYDTSDRNIQGGVRSKFHGVEESQSWPNEGSIRSFNSFSQEMNRMPGNDPRQPNLPVQDMKASQLAKISKESLGKKFSKFKRKKNNK
jgi:hypothetical protein